jgi:hypothetical protein
MMAFACPKCDAVCVQVGGSTHPTREATIPRPRFAVLSTALHHTTAPSPHITHLNHATMVQVQPDGKFAAPTACPTSGCRAKALMPQRSSKYTETVDFQKVWLDPLHAITT